MATLRMLINLSAAIKRDLTYLGKADKIPYNIVIGKPIVKRKELSLVMIHGGFFALQVRQ